MIEVKDPKGDMCCDVCIIVGFVTLDAGGNRYQDKKGVWCMLQDIDI